MKYIDEISISHKRILLRVDCNVSLNPDHTIANDERIRQILPTITTLLEKQNKIILLTHLGRPTWRDPALSLKPIVADLQKLLPGIQVKLVPDFQKDTALFTTQNTKTLLVLENIRYWEEEDTNDRSFAKQLASLADIYINDAFSVSHRKSATIVGLPLLLPSFGGLLLKKEITMLSKVTTHPTSPVVAILGGSKVSTKIHLISKLTSLADTILLGGGIANTFLAAHGVQVGKSLYEKHADAMVKNLEDLAKKHHSHILLPEDVITTRPHVTSHEEVKLLKDITASDAIFDIGPLTQAQFGNVIADAKTIIWNGPVGYFENTRFRRGTDFIYYAITQNTHATSIVGGGDTLAAISKKEYLSKITHISTGGGAMLEFIENGTLPGIEVLHTHHA